MFLVHLLIPRLKIVTVKYQLMYECVVQRIMLQFINTEATGYCKTLRKETLQQHWSLSKRRVSNCCLLIQSFVLCHVYVPNTACSTSKMSWILITISFNTLYCFVNFVNNVYLGIFLSFFKFALFWVKSMGHIYSQTNSTALHISCMQPIGYSRTLHREVHCWIFVLGLQILLCGKVSIFSESLYLNF